MKNAERVAAMLGDNGDAHATRLKIEELRCDSLAVLCISEGARYERDGEWFVFAWRDGSAIVQSDSGAWDIRAPGCERHCWAGAKCRCSYPENER
jgi:hypothetical protein